MTDQVVLPPRDQRAIASAAATHDQILRVKAVSLVTGLSKPTIYRAMNAGEFPRPVAIGAQAVGWFRSEIEQWIANRKNFRRQ